MSFEFEYENQLFFVDYESDPQERHILSIMVSAYIPGLKVDAIDVTFALSSPLEKLVLEKCIEHNLDVSLLEIDRRIKEAKEGF